MSSDVDLGPVIALYERELAQLDSEYQRRRQRLQLILGDLRDKLAREITSVEGASATVSAPTGEYSGLGVLEAAIKYLALVERPARAPEIAQALLRGGYSPKGEVSNFHNSVYNTLRLESAKANPRVRYRASQGFDVVSVPSLSFKPSDVGEAAAVSGESRPPFGPPQLAQPEPTFQP